MESDTLTSPRPSSSLPRGWPRSTSHVAPSQQRYESEDPATAYRATALRQLNGSPRPQSRPRVDNPPRRSSLATRPVLVRAYSGDEQRTPRPSSMSARRFLSFSSRSGAPRSQSDVALPSDKDFSIESILQAIEPDIRGTLDSIAEICGRSKLSLSNEYGSHIAPLGEICAPSALASVEQVIGERRDDSNVVVDEEASPVDPARDMHPFSFHRYLENIRQTASLEQNGDDQATQILPFPPLSPDIDAEEGVAIPTISTPFTREFVSRPKHSGHDLLAKNAPGSAERLSFQMVTSAVVSEVHLDATANDGSAESIPCQPTLGDDLSLGYSTPEIIQSLLGWLKWTTSIAGSESSPALQSAEGRLRAMLDRPGNEGETSPVP
ncbi:uncharacterized protein PGRI_055390 [Penicillium griseofulvum]|uniref:Uncharacterized protein n=1 Tax=Penicillium patulum TaxID=5078 RepID=A0A135LKQ8_PENPA|nr:uncharacterized protein PGRI_055390 [Penicillium griseofulvum]KXG49571.1 hypothetical protein PGRI_055390 [Penicillium griseofulvum]